MDMTGERLIAAPREKVWEALNDPEILKSSIPGCDSLVREAEDTLKASAAVKIGPISARFSGKVLLSDIDPPNGYRISGEGTGGVAGFARGGAVVRLADAAGGTRLTYEAKAEVGGKVAQLGARLIDATAKQMADTFFDRFAAALAPAPAAEPAPTALVPAARAEPGLPMAVWIGGVIFLAILILIFGSYL